MPPATLFENASDAEPFGCRPPDSREPGGRAGSGVSSAPRHRIGSIDPDELADLVLWDPTTASATQFRRLLDKAR